MAWVASVALGGNDGFDVSCSQILADRIGVIAFVCEEGLDPTGDHTEQRPEALNIVALPNRQHEPEWATLGIASRMEFGAEAPSRSAKSLYASAERRGGAGFQAAISCASCC